MATQSTRVLLFVQYPVRVGRSPLFGRGVKVLRPWIVLEKI